MLPRNVTEVNDFITEPYLQVVYFLSMNHFKYHHHFTKQNIYVEVSIKSIRLHEFLLPHMQDTSVYAYRTV
jgi:hypothetical protein